MIHTNTNTQTNTNTNTSLSHTHYYLLNHYLIRAICRLLYNFNNSSMADYIVGGKYRVGRKLGSGSFGEIFLGKSNLLNFKLIKFTQG